MIRAKERIRTEIRDSYEQINAEVAQRIAALIRERNEKGQSTVLGLATGSTPVGIYRRLIDMHKDEGLDFSNVITFNLDEYYPMDPKSIHSYHRFMWENFFGEINIRPENVHIPRGDIPRSQVRTHCAEYEKAIEDAGGIDFQILGIGRTGHIGFNEPGTARNSRTRLIMLDEVTIKDAAADFFGVDNVPREAITMGVGTILEAREIVLIATGEHKAHIVRRAVEEPETPSVAASFLQSHPNATIYVDMPAAQDLTRIATPWLVGDVEWDFSLSKRAVVWLANLTGKAIRKLHREDYMNNHLAALAHKYPGGVDELNKNVFRDLRDRITEDVDLFSNETVIIFSPHPDDDVISMGGTFKKLIRRGNIVHTAYMTSGNIAIFDEDVQRYADFMRRIEHAFDFECKSLTPIMDKIDDFLAQKAPASVDIEEVQVVKKVIRESEAIAACRHVGIPAEQAHFLNLPFYQTGKVRKDPIGEADIEIVYKFLEKIRPTRIFVAGDLSDPHGTHRMCKDAIDAALERLDRKPEVWLYRGAWQEWDVKDADIFVPLTCDELRDKVMAIFKHESQKDKALFPGPYDDREFWQRAQERNMETAQLLDHLGLPEYHAMEAFVVVRP